MVYQGSNFISKELKLNLGANYINLKEVPIETLGSVGDVERYHAPLRSSYDKIRQEVDKFQSNEECLLLEFYPKNSTIVPKGLCLISLFFVQFQ